MVPGEQAEDAIVADVANGKDGEVRAMGVDAGQQRDGKLTMKSLLWHGGSVWDAWFSCASNQVRTPPAVRQDDPRASALVAWVLRTYGVLRGSSPVCSPRSRRWRRCC